MICAIFRTCPGRLTWSVGAGRLVILSKINISCVHVLGIRFVVLWPLVERLNVIREKIAVGQQQLYPEQSNVTDKMVLNENKKLQELFVFIIH